MNAALRSASALVLAVVLVSASAPSARGETPARYVPALHPPADGFLGSQPGWRNPASAAPRAIESFLAREGGAAPASGASLSPALAGLMSAVLPGSAQLAMGSRRGWIYLGVETAAWFGVWALREAGNQAEDDYRAFADEHWVWSEYDLGPCPDKYAGEPGYETAYADEGLGPRDFDEERARLVDLYDNARADWYDVLGDRVYACGWDRLGNRSRFASMRDDANGLFGAAQGLVAVAFLNHVVSAVDAAKMASNRRKPADQALDLTVRPGRGVVPDFRMTLRRSF